MKKIRTDFMLKELRRLMLCAAGLVVCIFVLAHYDTRLDHYRLYFLPGIATVIALASLRPALLAHSVISSLTDQDAFVLEKEYAVSHPVYRVWQGEIHLMQSFIVCRNRGRLIFIPVYEIERVELRYDHIGMRELPFAKFLMDTDRSIVIGFAPAHAKDSEAVFAWLVQRLGSEKVVC